MSKQLYTYLAKVRTVLKRGYYGELVIEDHKGNTFRVCCGNIDDNTLKRIRSQWTFIRFEYRGERFYFNKAIPCDPTIATMLRESYRQEQWNKKQSEEAEKENSLVEN